MQPETLEAFRRQLAERRARLTDRLNGLGPEAGLVDLLARVDRALLSLDSDDYGRCVVCREPVDTADLERNPLLEYCLCALSPRQQRALEHDLELARRIQASLLPDPGTTTETWETHYVYEPAGFVSGDYCDLWVRPDEPGILYFAVGDVSGKGVAASLLMAHLHAGFRSLLGAGVSLRNMVERLNRQLLDAGIATHFATLACGRLSDDGRLEIVNAGHCPPLLVRRGGGVDSIGPTGFPVGLLAEKPYEIAERTLEPGDALLLYTDGLTEARNPEGDEYGAERLEEFLRQTRDSTPLRLVRAVTENLKTFDGGGPRLDDLTVLALRRIAGPAGA